LHGDLPPAEQELALRPADGRRVVLATAIAETSLTVPGVRVVVDGGYRRAPRLDPGSGLTRLETLRISRAAADQRAGRAGREAPGTAIRLWTTALHRGLAPFDRAEILEAELSHLVLDCAAWGADPAALSFADPPPSGAIAAARALLTDLGALNDGASITDLGRRMARLGAHPRLAAMMLAATTPAESALAANLAALLEDRDPLRGAPAGIDLRLAALHGHPGDADRGAIARIRQGAQHYRARLSTRAVADGDPGTLLAAAFPDRIAQSRGEAGTFRLSGGGGARLPPTDPLARAKLLVAAGLEQKASARITLAAPLDPESLPESVAARCTIRVESGFDPATGTVFSRRRRRYGALVLEDRLVPADPAEVAATLARVVLERPERLPWTDAARQFQARVALMRGVDAAYPDLSDAALAQEAEWLAGFLLGMTRLAQVESLDLLQALRGKLTWEQQSRLDRELPTHVALPHGDAAVDYSGPVPVVAARAQKFYGLKHTPRLAGGRVPLQVALLSPAGRPAAITADLETFWRGAWADVRRDLRGRYPKHAWPEDPANSP
jgi:ATP-dependent helicase HrpB